MSRSAARPDPSHCHWQRPRCQALPFGARAGCREPPSRRCPKCGGRRCNPLFRLRAPPAPIPTQPVHTHNRAPRATTNRRHALECQVHERPVEPPPPLQSYVSGRPEVTDESRGPRKLHEHK
eukprot:365270-Chlamydomonas_euryale.AAC.4